MKPKINETSLWNFTSAHRHTSRVESSVPWRRHAIPRAAQPLRRTRSQVFGQIKLGVIEQIVMAVELS